MGLEDIPVLHIAQLMWLCRGIVSDGLVRITGLGVET